jgi:hypothetical protein
LDDPVQGEAEAFLKVSKPLAVSDAVQTKVSTSKLLSSNSGIHVARPKDRDGPISAIRAYRTNVRNPINTRL